jgi:kynurenine formamidase
VFDADGDGKPEPVFYNGFRAGVDIVPAKEDPQAESWARFEGTRAGALGIENLAEHGAQGRGVMIDLHAHFGRKRHAVGFLELQKIIEMDKVKIERGDIVCLHTGFAEMLLEFKKEPTPEALHHTCTGLDGRDEKLLQWVSDSGVSVLAADNYAVELFSAAPWKKGSHAMLPLHQHCLFKNGIHLGELWYFTPLARWLREHGRNRFLLTAPPLRLPGAVGSPATPIATV